MRWAGTPEGALLDGGLQNVRVASASLVLVTGSGPGLGKSTLARALAARLSTAGRRVSLFAEEEIESHPAFAEVMAEFESSGRVALLTLLRASSTYLHELDRHHVDVAVLDTLFAYLPSLLAWGRSDEEIAEFFARMEERFSGRAVVEIHLVGNLADALARAGEREGDGWIDGQVLKVSTYDGAREVDDVRSAAAHLEALEVRGAALLRSAPWRVEFLSTREGFASVGAKAGDLVDRFVGSSTSLGVEAGDELDVLGHGEDVEGAQ